MQKKTWRKKGEKLQKMSKALVKQMYYFFAQRQQLCTNMYAKLQ